MVVAVDAGRRRDRRAGSRRGSAPLRRCVLHDAALRPARWRNERNATRAHRFAIPTPINVKLDAMVLDAQRVQGNKTVPTQTTSRHDSRSIVARISMSQASAEGRRY